MKRLSVFIFIAVLAACSPKKKDKKKEERVEITPFIVTKAMLLDTTQIKTVFAQTDSGRMSMSTYKFAIDDVPMFLDPNQFRAFQMVIRDMIQDPGSLVYINGSPATRKTMLDRFVLCDSIKEISFNEKGEEIEHAIFACDSVTILNQINLIRFGESWHMNTATGMIDREVLCYSVYQWVPEKAGFRSLFEIYRDEESRKKAVRYNFW